MGEGRARVNIRLIAVTSGSALSGLLIFPAMVNLVTGGSLPSSFDFLDGWELVVLAVAFPAFVLFEVQRHKLSSPGNATAVQTPMTQDLGPAQPLPAEEPARSPVPPSAQPPSVPVIEVATVASGPFPRSASPFIDRPGPLGELNDVQPIEPTPIVQILFGMRGVGKSQLAAAYARQRLADGWPVVVWIPATTDNDLRTGFAEIWNLAAGRTGLLDVIGAADQARTWLRRQSGPCLLVFDNAEDPGMIARWLPSIGRIHVVITTTNSDFDTVGRLCEVPPFTMSEAVRHLERSTGVAADEAASDLARRVGQLPLALAQAAGLIGARRRYRDYRTFLDMLPADGISARLHPRSGDPYQYGTADTIRAALDSLSANDERLPHAVMATASILSTTGTSVALLRQILGADPDELDAAVAVLESRAVAQRTASAHVVTVHALTREVVVAGLLSTPAFAATTQDAAARLADVARDVNAELSDLAYRHYDDMVSGPNLGERRRAYAEWASEHLRIGELLGHADQLWEHAETHRDKLAGDAIRSILDLRIQLIKACLDSLNVTIAQERAPEVLSDCERELSLADEVTVSARRAAAEALAGHDLDESIDLHRENVAIAQLEYGRGHAVTRLAEDGLAEALEHQAHLHGGW
ncbi:MAG: hypothetical protein HOV79_19325 [Hamadaea sp.]|nr:hypothetical protein [Hamadaea sp.]